MSGGKQAGPFFPPQRLLRRLPGLAAHLAELLDAMRGAAPWEADNDNDADSGSAEG